VALLVIELAPPVEDEDEDKHLNSKIIVDLWQSFYWHNCYNYNVVQEQLAYAL